MSRNRYGFPENISSSRESTDSAVYCEVRASESLGLYKNYRKLRYIYCNFHINNRPLVFRDSSVKLETRSVAGERKLGVLILKMSDRALTLDALLDMSPVLNGQDVVRLAARHLLLGQLKAQPSVREVFFPGHDRDPVYGDRLDAAAAEWFNFDDYAATFVCQAIVRAKDDFEIHSLLNEAVIDEKLQALHKGPDWKKLGSST